MSGNGSQSGSNRKGSGIAWDQTKEDCEADAAERTRGQGGTLDLGCMSGDHGIGKGGCLGAGKRPHAVACTDTYWYQKQPSAILASFNAKDKTSTRLLVRRESALLIVC
jgi:hypothetical protein